MLHKFIQDTYPMCDPNANPASRFQRRMKREKNNTLHKYFSAKRRKTDRVEIAFPP